MASDTATLGNRPAKRPVRAFWQCIGWIFLAELSLLAIYRELSTFRSFSPLLMLMLAVAVALSVYVVFDIVHPKGRLRVKTFLALMAIVAIVLAMLSDDMSRGLRQRRAVALVESLGGQALYHNHGFNDPLWFKTRSGWIFPKWMIQFCGRDLFQDVGWISLNDLTERSLQQADLSPLSDVEDLSVGCKKLSPEGVALLADRLGRMRELQDLQIGSAALNQSNLQPIVDLPALRVLCLYDCELTRGGYETISRMQQLEFLRLELSTAPSLNDLKMLAKLPNLKSIFLYNSGLTDQETAELERALPNCEIWH